MFLPRPRASADPVDARAVSHYAFTERLSHATSPPTSRRKKADPKVGSFPNRAENYLAADAAAEAAVEAAAEAAAAASAAVEAAEAATAAAAAASAAGAATGASTGAATGAAGVSTTGAGATTASSFLAQAARATASRETISKDFFMGFSLIDSLKYTTLLR